MDKSELSSPDRSITLPADDFSVEDEELLERLYAALYGDAALSRAENTLRAYRADWNHFAAWCVQHQLESLPAKPATVVLYLSEAANTFKLSTIARRIASINEAHRSKDYELPIEHCDVHRMWNEIKRNKWEEPVTRKRPVLTQDIKDMLKALPSTRSGIRDRALLLLGLAGSMRCSDLARIDLGDLTFTTKGLAVTIPHSKTDLDGKKLHIPYATSPEICPV
jgi:site-specific recombinase XerD